MTDKIGLTFGYLIAHFIPGFIINLAVSYLFYDSFSDTCDFSKVKDYSAFIILIITFVSLAVGLITDAVRYVIVHLSEEVSKRWMKNAQKLLSISVVKSDEDDRKYYDWVIEHHFRFHQFYGNLTISISVIAIILYPKFGNKAFWLFALTGFTALAAFFSYKTTAKKLKGRFSEGG